MKCEKTLMKAARELFDHIQDTGEFVFAGPDYEGVSEKTFQQLSPVQVDALSSAVSIWEMRKSEGASIDASAFTSIVRDEVVEIAPESHEKQDKPGKKHGRRSYDDTGFEPRVRFR